MKKRHLLVMVAAVALLAVTCGGSGTNSATPTGSGSASPSGEPATPVILTFWHGYTDVEADSLKALFDAAGLQYPTDQWTWDDFRAAAKALTNPAKKQFGFSYPMDASEDTVWHYDPLLWQNGGSILDASNTKAAFNSPQGVQALQVL